MPSFYEDMAGVGLASGRSCATVLAVTVAPTDHETAHRMPAEMATETLLDLVASARAIETAIIEDHGPEAVARIREAALAQAEAYLDLTAEAARHVRALKP